MSKHPYQFLQIRKGTCAYVCVCASVNASAKASAWRLMLMHTITLSLYPQTKR